MGMSKETLEKNIKRLLSVIKPEGVIMVDFVLDEIGQKNGYYLSLKYIVPDLSPYLMSVNRKDSEQMRITWNNEIKKSIQNYFDTHVIINSTSMTSETYYKQQKERDSNN
jgi:hypothetical protein